MDPVELLNNPKELLNIEASGLDAAVENLIERAVHFGTQLLVAVLVFWAGMWIANKITRSLKSLMEARKFDPSLKSFLGSFVNILLKIFVFIIVLTTVGVQMTSIVAVLGTLTPGVSAIVSTVSELKRLGAAN